MAIEMSMKLSPKQTGRLYQKSMKQEDEIKALKAQLEKYKRLAKERGAFIINGEELGYISTPTSETDKAYHVFMRCQMTDEAAAEDA